MNLIDSVNEKTSNAYFENIDRIINAERITKIDEMKQLIRFIDHLIQNIIHQITNGMLSEKGAKIKIFHLFNIIQHCMIGNHPAIKPQINRLLNIFEQKYKYSIYSKKPEFKPGLMVLEAKKVEHYVESILDKHNDPIYSEKPRPNNNDINEKKHEEKNNPTKPKKNEVRNYFISTMYLNLEQKNKLELNEINDHKKNEKRVQLFSEIKQSLPKNVYTTR